MGILGEFEVKIEEFMKDLKKGRVVLF